MKVKQANVIPNTEKVITSGDANTVTDTPTLTLEDANTVRLESNLNPCAQHLAREIRLMIPQPSHVDAYLIARILGDSVPQSEQIEGQYSFLMGMDVDVLDKQGEWTGETVFQKLRVYFPACTIATLDKLFIQSTHSKKNAKTGKVDTIKRNGALTRVLFARSKDLWAGCEVEACKVGNKTHRYIKYLPEFTIDDLRGAKVSRLDATLKILLGTLFTCEVRTTGDLFDTVSTDGDFTILKNGDLTVVTVRKDCLLLSKHVTTGLTLSPLRTSPSLPVSSRKRMMRHLRRLTVVSARRSGIVGFLLVRGLRLRHPLVTSNPLCSPRKGSKVSPPI